MAAPATNVVNRSELHAFCVRSLMKVGGSLEHSTQLATVVTDADYRGHFSHGLNRLRFYVNSYQYLNKNDNVNPEIIKETIATALVDGKNLLGPVVGNFCMRIAIKKAKDVGIGWVSVNRSNHFGIAGFYSMQAMKEGLIGMAFCNATPVVVPTRAKESVFGTNPISVAAPANNDSFVLDMATSTVAVGKVELKHRLGEDLPAGWGLDANGTACNDTNTVLKVRKLTPLGGMEETSGYKGYGLSMMVEIFCSILSGANPSHSVKHPNPIQETNLGQCFVALDPSAFAPGFEDRLSQLMDDCRSLESIDPDVKVLIPGDPERIHMEYCDKIGGIPYHDSQIQFADDIANEYGVTPVERKNI